MTDTAREAASGRTSASAPARAELVLVALILVAAVANLNLAVANVALPVDRPAFDASQTQLNLVAVGYSLGLAASVLYLGAIGDRYGRKLLLDPRRRLVGARLPAGRVRAIGSRSWSSRALARRALRRHGLPDHPRPDHRAVGGAGAHASRSRCGRASAARSPRSGRCSPASLLQHFWWGSVFLLTLPLAVVALVMAIALRARRTSTRRREPVDNLGGILSVVLVGALILAINFAPVPGRGRRSRWAWRRSRSPRRSRSCSGSAARANPAVRPARSPRGASSGSRRAPGSSSSAR